MIVYLKAKGPEFYSYGDLMLLFEFVVHDSLHETRFTHACISDDDQLKKMVLGTESLVSDDLEGHAHKLVYLFLLHFK